MAARGTPAFASGILSYFTRHATVANLLLVVMIVAGIMSYPRMRAQFFPDVIVDTISVRVAWDGAGAEDMDAAVVQVLEPTLLAVEGVAQSDSRSSEGSARIRLEFEPGWDMARALDDVETAVSSVSGLPDGAEDPSISRAIWRDTVTDVVLTGPVGIDQLARFTDEMIARLFAEGVTRTEIRGVVAPRILIEVPTLSLVRHDVSLSEIAGAIAAEVDTAPAGDVASGASRVRTGVAKRSADEIERIVLRSNPDGSVLTIGDVGRIEVEGVDRYRAYFVGRNPAVTINVSRSETGDAIGIQEQVEAVAAELLPNLPDGMQIDLVDTRSEVITARLNILFQNGAMGLALVVILLFLFLNSRTALWVALGIPVSMLAAVALMYAAGLTINMISLFALIITLGIVVDDAIVVGEHADFRARRRGESPVVAAESAARRMFPPVFSATLTTLIAFFGLTAIGGRFGEMIADIPFTVIVVLAASLVECFLILPNHMSHALGHTAEEHWYDWPSRQVNKGFRWVRDTLFRPLMGFVVAARYPVLALAVAALSIQVSTFLRGDLQFRFFDAPERGSVSGNFAMVNGATREDTLDYMYDLQDAVAAFSAEMEAEFGTDPISYVITQVGGGSGRGLASADGKDAELLGGISLELVDADLRPYSSFELVSRLEAALPDHPMLEEVAFRGGRFGPGGDGLDVELSGSSGEVLKAAAEALKDAVAQFGEVTGVEDSMAYDKEELVLELTPQGEALGFTIDDLSGVLRSRLNGIEAASFPDGLRTASVRVQLPPDELTADFLQTTLMRTDDGYYVPLGDIVTATARTGFSTVIRENGLRVISVTGDVDESDPARAAEIQLALETDILPTLSEDFGVSYRLAGLSEQQDEFLADAMFGLTLCLVGIYLTLAWIFASWTRPLVVMAVIPFGLVGAFYGHNHWDMALSMFSIVGLIGMVGIIINDSIVLVTTIDEYAEDRDLRTAIIEGTADRLRPVFLTTATTVLGLAPLIYEGSSQAQFLKPTVITLAYGLGFGFFLVLLVVPALVAVQQDVQQRVQALKRMLAARRRAPRPALFVGALGLLVVAAFAVTMGWVLVTGALPAPLAGGTLPPILRAGAMFLGFALVLTLAGWIGALVAGRSRRAA